MTHVRPRMSDLHKLFVCALTATALAGSITSAAFAQPDRRDGQDRGQQGQYDNHGNRDDRGEHRGASAWATMTGITRRSSITASATFAARAQGMSGASTTASTCWSPSPPA